MSGRKLHLFTLCAVLLPQSPLFAADPAPAAPPYQIVMRSRNAQANPRKTKDAQTGGGYIYVQQPEANTLLILMAGAAVAGSEFHGSSAGISFDLDQMFDIIPTRTGLRPPRIAMVGQVVGTLQITNSGCCSKNCGTAEQAVGTAFLLAGDHPLLSVAVKPSAVGVCNPVFVDNKEGPVEVVAAVGSYNLKQSFAIGVTQGKGVFNRQFAVADFDPAPQLDGYWSDALKPFRAIPRKDFGFRIVLRVVEDPSGN